MKWHYLLAAPTLFVTSVGAHAEDLDKGFAVPLKSGPTFPGQTPAVLCNDHSRVISHEALIK